jgi:hypothetical protein
MQRILSGLLKTCKFFVAGRVWVTDLQCRHLSLRIQVTEHYRGHDQGDPKNGGKIGVCHSAVVIDHTINNLVNESKKGDQQ